MQHDKSAISSGSRKWRRTVDLRDDQDGRDRPRHEALTSRILNVCQLPLTQEQIAEATGESLTRVCTAMKRLKAEGRLDLVGTLGNAMHAPKLWRAIDKPVSAAGGNASKTRQNAPYAVKTPPRTPTPWREYSEPVAFQLARLRCQEARKYPSVGSEG